MQQLPVRIATPDLFDLIAADAAGSDRSPLLSVCEDGAEDQSSDRSPLLSVCEDGGPTFSLCEDGGPEQRFSFCEDGVEQELSDARLKTGIEQVGTTVYGLPLYQFCYKTGPERFEGVMAQDVLEVMPDAVVTGEDGYYRVNYGRLGIRMTCV